MFSILLSPCSSSSPKYLTFSAHTALFYSKYPDYIYKFLNFLERSVTRTEATVENPQRHEAREKGVTPLNGEDKQERMCPSVMASWRKPLAKPDLLEKRKGQAIVVGPVFSP